MQEEDIKNKSLGTSETRSYNRYLASITESAKTPDEKVLATEVINYIIRQLNTDSLRGTINHFEFRNMIENAVDGLFLLIYIEFYSANLVNRDTIFASSNNYLWFLFSRVMQGRDREIIIKEIESRRPIYLSGMQGGGQ